MYSPFKGQPYGLHVLRCLLCRRTPERLLHPLSPSAGHYAGLLCSNQTIDCRYSYRGRSIYARVAWCDGDTIEVDALDALVVDMRRRYGDLALRLHRRARENDEPGEKDTTCNSAVRQTVPVATAAWRGKRARKLQARFAV
jgi:hypothetical protein